MAGGLYPFPMFEDGDFDIPSVYLMEEEGQRLARHIGEDVLLKFESRRIPSRGCNVIARKGVAQSPRAVFCAHIDAKKGTPGALDNAAGVAVLLALAETLRDYSGRLGLEIVALNGEDYYAAPGQLQYASSNAGKLGEVLLGLFVMCERPTVAITSEKAMGLMASIIHTGKDQPELVDCRKLAFIAQGLASLFLDAENSLP